MTGGAGVRAAVGRGVDAPGGPDVVVGNTGTGARGTVEDDHGKAAGSRVPRG